MSLASWVCHRWGFAAEGEAMPSVVYYDVPEWSVMLANSWRQFPATLGDAIPRLAFFIAIAGFTFLGEGPAALRSASPSACAP